MVKAASSVFTPAKLAKSIDSLSTLKATKPTKVTTFRRRVWGACALIPEGKVSTYGAIAEALGTSPRAVGQALKVNPYAPCVPCHRVVATDGLLCGFDGQTEGPKMDKKAKMLKEEGITIDKESRKVREKDVIC